MKHLNPSQEARIVEILRSGEAGRVRMECEKESHAYALELCETIKTGGWEVVSVRVRELNLPKMITDVAVCDYASPGTKAHRLLSVLREVGVTDVHDFATSENAEPDCVCLIVGRIVR